MEEKKTTILIVDDDKSTQVLCNIMLKNYFNLLQAYTEEEAEKFFMANQKEIRCVIMDGCLLGDEIDTIPLVHKFRGAGYVGPIIASSNRQDFRNKLIEAGCDCQSDKGMPLFQKLHQMFNIPETSEI